MNRKRICISICIAVVLIFLVLSIIRITQVSRYLGQNESWTAVCMNTEGQHDGTWSGYLVYEGTSESLESVYADVTVDGEHLYSEKLALRNSHISLFGRLITGIFDKPFYCFYSLGSDPKSLNVQIRWTEDDEQKTEIIKMP